MYQKAAEFRFYEELNDHLARERRKTSFVYQFNGKPSIKDAIESIGVPHGEVDLIVVNGESVGFAYQLRDGDNVAVYPVFESLDISPAVHLRASPLRKPAFVVDGHLGKLARLLRMFGLDTRMRSDVEDGDLIRSSLDEKRIILTRDRQLLKAKRVTHGYWVRASLPLDQIREVLDRFDLCRLARPFIRCMDCNGLIVAVDRESIADQLPERTRELTSEFGRCSECGKIYWKGTHYQKMKKLIEGLCHES